MEQLKRMTPHLSSPKVPDAFDGFENLKTSNSDSNESLIRKVKIALMKLKQAFPEDIALEERVLIKECGDRPEMLCLIRYTPKEGYAWAHIFATEGENEYLGCLDHTREEFDLKSSSQLIFDRFNVLHAGWKKGFYAHYRQSNSKNLFARSEKFEDAVAELVRVI